MSEVNVESTAREAFFKDLMKWLWKHPYWMKTMTNGKRGQKRRLSFLVAKMLYSIPKVGDPKVHEVIRELGD